MWQRLVGDGQVRALSALCAGLDCLVGLRGGGSLGLHAGFEEAQCVAAPGLGLIHGDVGVLQQRGRGLFVAAERRDAYAARASMGMAGQEVG